MSALDRTMFEASMSEMRNDFMLDLEFVAKGTARHAHLSLLCAPLDVRAEALRVHFEAFQFELFKLLLAAFRSCAEYTHVPGWTTSVNLGSSCLSITQTNPLAPTFLGH